MEFKPHPYQLHAIDFCLANDRSALFLDMGLGKTSITLTVLNSWLYDSFTAQRVLVIVPPKILDLETWQKEIEKWDHLKHLTTSSLTGTPKERLAKLNERSDITFISCDLIHWLVDTLGTKWNYDTVVVDESSKFKSPKSRRFKSLKKVSRLYDRAILLTGTPSPNGYEDLWSQLYILDRGQRLGANLSHYRAAYFNPDKRNQHVIFSYKLKPGAKEQIDNRLTNIAISMKAKDWLTMPERIDNVITFDLSPKERSAYEQLERDYVLEASDGQEISAGQKATLINKLKQLTGGAVYTDDGTVLDVSTRKIELLEEIVDNTNKPLLVFYAYRHERDRLFKTFEHLQPRDLATPQDITDWNEGNIKMLICHPASVGYGLNIQYGSNTIVWFGLDWSLEHYQQANARLYRQGQSEAVIIHHLIAKDTVDELVYQAIERKELTQEGLLEALKRKVNAKP